jgi:hypothetical protein
MRYGYLTLAAEDLLLGSVVAFAEALPSPLTGVMGEAGVGSSRNNGFFTSISQV